MVSAFGFLALVFFVLGGAEILRARRRERDLVGPDVRELSGKVASSETLTSPVAGEPCVWYRVEISRWGSAAGTQGSYSVVHEEKKGIAFDVEREAGDGSRVDASEAELLEPENRTVIGVGQFDDDPTPAIRALLVDRGLPLARDNGELYSYSIVEDRLAPGQSVHVRGLLRSEDGRRVLGSAGPARPLLFAHRPPSAVSGGELRRGVILVLIGVALGAAPFVHRWLR